MFFSPLSIFSQVSSLQSPKKAAAGGWLANDCALCGAGCGRELLCAACAASLPRIGPACARCGLPLSSGEVCGACLRDVPAFDGAVTAFAYGFPLDRLVQRFKYGGDLAIGCWLASALAQRVAHESRPQLLVAPPLTRARLRERGFNQALEVAKVVGRGMRVRCSLHGVRRRHDDAPQAGLSRRERLANLRDAFDCREDVRGLDVAVVDDVLTTGATAEAMARALKKSGARSVRIWAVARTLEPGDV